MGNCTDTCKTKNEQLEAAPPANKKEASYMVGTNKNNNFDVEFWLYKDIFDTGAPQQKKIVLAGASPQTGPLGSNLNQSHARDQAPQPVLHAPQPQNGSIRVNSI